MPCWQPIESAPKNALVALWLPEWGSFAARPWYGAWSHIAGQWSIHTPMLQDDKILIAPCSVAPTHWMPRPAPPAAPLADDEANAALERLVDEIGAFAHLRRELGKKAAVPVLDVEGRLDLDTLRKIVAIMEKVEP